MERGREGVLKMVQVLRLTLVEGNRCLLFYDYSLNDIYVLYDSLNIHTITAQTARSNFPSFTETSNIFIDISISQEYPSPPFPKALITIHCYLNINCVLTHHFVVQCENLGDRSQVHRTKRICSS